MILKTSSYSCVSCWLTGRNESYDWTGRYFVQFGNYDHSSAKSSKRSKNFAWGSQWSQFKFIWKRSAWLKNPITFNSSFLSNNWSTNI